VMLDVYHNHELNNQIASQALTFAYQHSWEMRKGDYLALIERLTQVPSRGDNANR